MTNSRSLRSDNLGEYVERLLRLRHTCGDNKGKAQIREQRVIRRDSNGVSGIPEQVQEGRHSGRPLLSIGLS